MEARCITAHPHDNVAVVVNVEGVRAGDRITEGLSAREEIPQAHKVSLRDIARGGEVLRYGERIGTALEHIRAGAWVREELVGVPEAPDLESIGPASSPPPPPPPLEGETFEGYANADGSYGTRNALGILATVACVAPTVEHAAARLRAEVLPRYPGVDDVVALTHGYGCGVAIDAPLAAVPIRTLWNIARNPNLGGPPLVVSLGCEKLQPSRLGFSSPGVLVMQERGLHGFSDTVAAIMRQAEARLGELDRRRRAACPASGLVVGLQCGGSDAFSGITANPAVGVAADLLVRCGATVLFSEVTEVRDAVHLLMRRAATPEVARALVREMRWYDGYLRAGGADRTANPTPGNKRGGLVNVVEKALGSVAKSGSAPIASVATHGERVTAKGLVFAATPASDFICGTLQLASMNVHVFTTGQGSPYGLPLVPVIKVSSRTELAERWPDLIDVDAGRIATGAATTTGVGREIFRFILEAASGRKPWAERWGLKNALELFNPGPIT